MAHCSPQNLSNIGFSPYSKRLTQDPCTHVGVFPSICQGNKYSRGKKDQGEVYVETVIRYSG